MGRNRSARSDSALVCANVWAELGDSKELAQPFTHPVLEDLYDDRALYLLDELPPQQAQLVSGQAEVILGFKQALA